MAERHKFPVKHGGWKEHRAEYRCWQDMKQRCLNPASPSFKNYGGRGITVCERWLNNFQTFLEDMGKRPDEHSLDRIDNDKGYAPENCRWATSTTQSRNTRRATAKDAGVIFELTSAKWVAYITVKKRSIRVGAYESKNDAIAARKVAELHYWQKENEPPARGSPPKNNTSGFVGVHKDKRWSRWTAYYGSRANRQHIGSFASAEEAASARAAWLKAHDIT